MEHLDIEQLEQQLDDIVVRVESGESFIIFENGQPVAQLVPVDESAEK